MVRARATTPGLGARVPPTGREPGRRGVGVGTVRKCLVHESALLGVVVVGGCESLPGSIATFPTFQARTWAVEPVLLSSLVLRELTNLAEIRENVKQMALFGCITI